jgi:dihydrofolate reductase
VEDCISARTTRAADREEGTPVAKLIYSAIMSLDGYIADDGGNFDWAEPDEEVHTFVNELERPVGTYLYGRRMYEMMLFWETSEAEVGQPPVVQDFARMWRAADKVVYSTSLTAASSARTRIERAFDPESVRALKASAARDLGIGGADLSGQVIKAGLVDEYQLFAVPVLVGGGTRALPEGVRVRLELQDLRRFDNGTVFSRYTVSGTA